MLFDTHTKKTMQSGRTMIEILAVLSIVAILSLGGIIAFDRAQGSSEANKIISGTGEIYAIAKVKGHTTSTKRERKSASLPKQVKEIKVTPKGIATVTITKCISKEIIQALATHFGYCIKEIKEKSDTTSSSSTTNPLGLQLYDENEKCDMSNEADLITLEINLFKDSSNDCGVSKK